MPSSWPSEVPERYVGCRLDGYLTETASQVAALREARRFVVGEISGLVLVGPTGLGKSHLAAGVSIADATTLIAEHNAAFDRGEHRIRPPAFPLWQNVAMLVVKLRTDRDRPVRERTAAARADALAAHDGVVVLDDLGREWVSDWTAEIVYTLISERYENRRPTVVTTNLTGDELMTLGYWPAISRLAEGGTLVRIDGRDRRLGSAVNAERVAERAN